MKERTIEIHVRIQVLLMLLESLKLEKLNDNELEKLSPDIDSLTKSVWDITVSHMFKD